MPCVALDSVISGLRLWLDQQSVIGEILAPEKAVSLGKKPVMKVTLRIQDPNFGSVTAVSVMLSSMNFEEVSTFRTYLGGSIVTHSVWRRKEARSPSVQPVSGLPVISTPTTGTPTLITEPAMPS